MKRYSFLFAIGLAFLMVVNLLNVKAQTTFQKTFSNGEYLFGNDIGFYNGCYFIAGASKTNTNSMLFLEKTSVSGDSLWTFYFTAQNPIEGKKIIPGNGDLYVAANSYMTSGSTKGLLAKIKENGYVIWSKTFGTNESQIFNDAIMPDDSTILVVGTVTGTGAGQKDIIVSLLDTSGAVRWSRTYGTTKSERGNSIIKTSDTCFVIAGFTDFFDPSGDMLVMKISTAGTIKWAKTYNIIHSYGSDYYTDQAATDIMETLTHFLVVTGSTKTGEFSPTDQQWSPVILKLGMDGSLIHAHDYSINSGNNQAYQILETANGSYLVLSSTNEFMDVLFKTNTAGITDWCHYISPGSAPDYYCFPRAMCISNGSFVITGSRNSQIDTVLHLVKTNSSGWSGCYDESVTGYEGTINPVLNPVTFSTSDVFGSNDFPLILQYMNSTPYIICEIPTGIETIEEAGTIYPNPVIDYLYLDKIPELVEYGLFDCSGNEIAKDKLKIIDFRNIRPGIYILKMITEKGIFSHKVVKLQW
jgi:hypothetical protein